jgi:hypothetical protein
MGSGRTTRPPSVINSPRPRKAIIVPSVAINELTRRPTTMAALTQPRASPAMIEIVTATGNERLPFLIIKAKRADAI